MDERKVKGAMLVDQVRMIRASKALDWSNHLTAEDWAVVNSQIMDAAWYPLEVYRHLGTATFEVLANGDVDIARRRGQARGKELFGGLYRDIVMPGNPLESLRRFTSRYDLLFNFSSLTLEAAGEKRAKLHHDYSAEDPSNVPYCYQLLGHLEALVETAGARSVKVELVSKQWEGAPATVFDVSWQ